MHVSCSYFHGNPPRTSNIRIKNATKSKKYQSPLWKSHLQNNFHLFLGRWCMEIAIVQVSKIWLVAYLGLCNCTIILYILFHPPLFPFSVKLYVLTQPCWVWIRRKTHVNVPSFGSGQCWEVHVPCGSVCGLEADHSPGTRGWSFAPRHMNSSKPRWVSHQQSTFYSGTPPFQGVLLQTNTTGEFASNLFSFLFFFLMSHKLLTFSVT